MKGNGMEVERLADAIFRVSSESGSDLYVVDLAVPKCTCVDWATKRNKLIKERRARGINDDIVHYECKHVRAAKEHSGDMIRSEHEKLEEQKQEIKQQYRKKKNKKELLETMRTLAGDESNAAPK